MRLGPWLRVTCVLVLLSGCDKDKDEPPAVEGQPAAAEPAAPAGEAPPDKAPAEEAAAAEPTEKAEAKPTAVAVDLDEESDFPIEGALRVVKRQGLTDAAPIDEGEAWLRVKSVDTHGMMIDESVKVAIFPPADEDVEAAEDEEPAKPKPLAKGGSDSFLKVPAGIYDVRVRYKASRLAKADGWIRGVELPAEEPSQLRVVFDLEVSELRVAVTSQGQDVSDRCRVRVFDPGAHPERGLRRMVFDAAEGGALPKGTYDLKVVYRESRDVEGHVWHRGVEIPGDGGKVEVEVDIPLEFAFFRLDLENHGTAPEGKLVWHLYDAGVKPEDTKKKARFRGVPGKAKPVLAGTYDLRVKHKLDNGIEKTTWYKKVKVPGDRSELTLSKDLKWSLGSLTVAATKNGKDIGKHGKVQVFSKSAGDKPVLSFRTGKKAVLPAGTYRVAVKHRRASAEVRTLKVKRGADTLKAVALQ